MIVVRDAIASDADALGRVHVEAWRAAYRGMMPDHFLASLDPAVRAARWRERLANRIEGRAMFVVQGDIGLPYGFAGVGPARDERGTGASSALLARATEVLRDFGHLEAILWVLRQNARARRFYEREGWKQTGDRRDTISENGFTFEVDELRYGRAL